MRVGVGVFVCVKIRHANVSALILYLRFCHQARPCPVLSDSISDYANLEEVPVAKLSWKTRRHFSLLMDIEQVVAADWRMLADSFGFDCREISCMGREKSPSMCLLESLALRSITVGQLLEELLRLDRKDAVTELTEMVEKRMAQQVVVT